MAPSSLKKTVQSYKTTANKLETKLEQLRRKKEEVDSRAFVVLDEVGRGDQSRPLEEHDVYRTEVGSLVSTATDILIEILQLKLMFVQESLHKLMTLLREYPKSSTPQELSYTRYEEWLETNQRLFELNSQLYDLEKLKFEIKQKQTLARKAIARGGRTDNLSTGSQFIQSSVQRILTFLTRFRFSGPATSTTQIYIQELLNPRGNKRTLESQKIQEYVAECLQHAEDEFPDTQVGAQPQRYQEFMGILCNYIVEKQRETQGEELSCDLVYSVVERHLMPQIKSSVLRLVSQRARDELIAQQCMKFSDVTLDQLRVKPDLQSKELVPFIDSITHLRASYFSPNPTDKMYTIVAAAKALYDQLGVMGEMSIDGDSFLDLWVYVILKANIKDLATNIQFMCEYSNPQLSKDEAGYYLTTLEAAASFIERLTPAQLKAPQNPQQFVVCERRKFSQLAKLPSSCFKVVKSEEELHGYKVAVVQEWALNRARLTPESSTMGHVHYFSQCLTQPQRSVQGLYCQETPLGAAVLVDRGICDPQNLIILPSGDFDTHYQEVQHVLQLLRLGSQGMEGSPDTCMIPPSCNDDDTTTRSRKVSGIDISSSQFLTPEHSIGRISTHDYSSYAGSITPSPYLLENKPDLEDSFEILSTSDSVPSLSNATPDGSLGTNPTVNTITIQVEVHDDTPPPGVTMATKETTVSCEPSLSSVLFPQGSSGSKQQDTDQRLTRTFDDSFCPLVSHLTNPKDILSPEFSRELEKNFIENHLYGVSSQPVEQAMMDIIKQGQMYLQRLNYLSVTYKTDGVYSDAMLHAVKSFQTAHNAYESRYSMVLPENGYLTAATFQFLRQAFLTIYASMLRLGLDQSLGESFNPMSTADEDIQNFRDCVYKFQKERNLVQCQPGALCANTIEKLRHLLRTQRHTM